MTSMRMVFEQFSNLSVILRHNKMTSLVMWAIQWNSGGEMEGRR